MVLRASGLEFPWNKCDFFTKLPLNMRPCDFAWFCHSSPKSVPFSLTMPVGPSNKNKGNIENPTLETVSTSHGVISLYLSLWFRPSPQTMPTIQEAKMRIDAIPATNSMVLKVSNKPPMMNHRPGRILQLSRRSISSHQKVATLKISEQRIMWSNLKKCKVVQHYKDISWNNSGVSEIDNSKYVECFTKFHHHWPHWSIRWTRRSQGWKKTLRLRAVLPFARFEPPADLARDWPGDVAPCRVKVFFT